MKHVKFDCLCIAHNILKPIKVIIYLLPAGAGLRPLALQTSQRNLQMLFQVNNSLRTSKESETDTLFKAENRKMTPHSRKKQNY